jgi:CDP-diacylglycerol pyrophosphatase
LDLSILIRIRLCVPGILLVLAIVTASSAQAASRRDILWDIVTNCLNTTAADYCTACKWPRTDSTCPQKSDYTYSTEVWAESDAFVVLRDAKMYGCPEEFVHGLALPRARVTGVEDPGRPEGIWKFAWDTGVRRTMDSSELALVVNPPGNRSQDQLHIHLVRLKDDALPRIRQRQTTSVKSLDDVWRAAARSAAEQGLEDYGVLVFQRSDGSFTVLVEQENPEKKYTRFRCR